jgi:flagellar biosynthesis GTPase FlhF
VQQGKTTGASRDQVERETSRETSRDQTERETSKETSQGERERETITETSRTSREEREQETSREATQEQAEEKEAEGKGAAADRDSTRAFAFLRDNDKLFTWLIIGFLVAIAVVFLIILIIRNGGFALLSPQKGFKTLMNVYRGGSSADRAIEMTVRGQNPNIGFRNVKHIKKGQSRSVGGKNSDFLIFFVPLPAKIGSITRKDDTYSFRPVKKEFFPDIEGDIEDCLGKEIRAVTREGTFTITFIFKKYISKLEQVNRIMHLIDEPGTPRE